MKSEEIQELIREQTRSSIKDNINRVDEVFDTGWTAAGVAALSALGYGWYSYREAVKKSTRNKAFNDFLEQYDTNNLVYKKVPDLVRRFQLVNSLTDLETIEARAEALITELEKLEREVDGFANSQERLGNRLRDRSAGLSGDNLRREVKRHISNIILASRKGFEQEIENKKDELLGEI